MDERQKLMLQMRVMRASIDPKLLSQMEKVAVAFFGPVLDGKVPPRGVKLGPAQPPASGAAPASAKPKPKAAIDGRAVALRALEARQRRAGPDGFVPPRADAGGPLSGPESGGNALKTVDLYLAELRKSRESAAEIVERAAAKARSGAPAPEPAVRPDPKRGFSAEEMDDKKRNFLKRWFVK